MTMESMYRQCRDMFKEMSIKVVVPHQHPPAVGYRPTPTPPINGVILIDYITLLKTDHGKH